MSFRAIWVDEGNDAAYHKLTANKITEPFYSVNDPRVTLPYLTMVKQLGFSPGVYAAWNTLPPPYTGAAKGAAFATWLSQQLERIAPNSPPHFPSVCADIETHDVPYILGFLKQWRKHRPNRITDWTLEGMQGGLFSPVDVIKIMAANVRVIPQLYRGAMQPQPPGCTLDLLRAGFNGERIYGFYDAAALTYRWEGYAFTQGRLP